MRGPMKARGHSGPGPERTGRSRFWRRVKWTFGGVFALVLASMVLIGGSVWMEDRHPCEDPARAWFPRTQRLVTKPIVEALSRRIGDYFRSQAEARYMKTGLSLEETIVRFLDERIDLSARRGFAFRLARERTPEAVAALLKVLRNAPAEDRAYMAELIGRTGDDETKEWLWPLLGDSDERVIRAAIRGLALIGGKDVTGSMASLLTDPTQRESVRVEAAIALGTIGTTGSQLALIEAFGNMPSPAVASEILNALGRCDFEAVAPTFRAYLSSSDASGPLRVAAVEALSNSTIEATPFLLEIAGGDQDPDVRASAAWAISAHQSASHLGGPLADLAAREPEPDVRRRLYEAMLTQADLPASQVLPVVLAEKEVAARIAGLNTLGKLTRMDPTSPVASTFDAELVPELQRLATDPNSLNLQMRAVFALRRADSPAAREALANISSNAAAPQVATAARNGLRVTNR